VADLIDDHGFSATKAAERIPLGIGEVTRIAGSTNLQPRQVATLVNGCQRFAAESTRLGVPVLVHEEATAGFCARGATTFPQALGLAATFDPGLVERVAGAVRDEMLAVGTRQALAPVLDVARDPRWGRVEESYGEDPVLVGTLGSAYVRGLHGQNLSGGILATGKHFVGHAMSEGGRNHGPVQLGFRELREVYAEPFAAAIREAGLAAVMNAYSSVDGLPCAGSRHILTNLLREELGFEGMVVADYFSVALLISHHRTATDKREAAVQALTAGLDLELPATDCFGAPLLEAITAGQIPMEIVDRAVARVLATKFRLGLFEAPFVDVDRAAAVFDSEQHRSLARQAAAEAIVLLTNDGVLPLEAAPAIIAVIGPGADDPRLLQGDYHYPAHQENGYEPVVLDSFPAELALPLTPTGLRPGPFYTPHVTPLAGILAHAPRGAEVLYERGCEVDGGDRSGFPAATEVARRAGVAIVVVGGRSGLAPSSTVGEGRDAVELSLTGVQEDLVHAISETGTPMIVVVLSGRVHTLSGVAAVANALLVAAPLGEEGGAALADVIFGARDASGRLPVTLPRHVGQLPIYAGARAGGDTAMFYGRYIDSPIDPLFFFGHGLSYTTFAFDRLRVSATSTEEPITLEVDVRNVGDRDGVEVVQCYVRDEAASVARPKHHLLGFARVELRVGAAVRITFEVHPSRLAFFNEDLHFVVEPGGFTFWVGRSANDLTLSEHVELKGHLVEFTQRQIVSTKVSAKETTVTS
jgi:beta-glucosidase